MTKTRRIEITIETHEITRINQRTRLQTDATASDRLEVVNDAVGPLIAQGIPEIESIDPMDTLASTK